MSFPSEKSSGSGSLEHALQALFHRNLHVMKLDLEPMRALLGLLGQPQASLLCVHVAGTNGKGSVCAMLASVLIAQGYKTGLYTSPHLVRFNERIQIQGQPIDDATLKALIDEVEAAAANLPGLGFRDVTFFEFTTALAFLFFARQQVQVVVLETGMGGRLDATNMLVPAVSVITSIGLEHTRYLGDTLEKITAEKAGIIKAGRPVVVGQLPEEAMEVVTTRAKALGAPLRVARDLVQVAVRKMTLEGQVVEVASEQESYGSISMKLSGHHQAGNVAVVVAVAECLDREVGVSVGADALKSGLAAATWPARNQLLEYDPPVVLDGAHNPEAAAALAAWLKKVGGKRPIGLVGGFLADKDPAAFVRAFHGHIRRIWLVPLASERGMPVEEILQRLAGFDPAPVTASLEDALAAARRWAEAENGLVLIAGSLYLAGQVMKTTGTLVR